MLKTRIKICGVRDPDTALAAVYAGADAIGLIFVAGSPRRVTTDQARCIVEALPAFIDPVGVFVDTPIQQIRETARQVGFCTVQLHGSETPDQAAQLAPLRVVKALAFDPHKIAATLKPWLTARRHLAAVMWDTPDTPDTPPSKGDRSQPQPPSGGTGCGFDWAALAKIQTTDGLEGSPPMILAGGLTPGNVARAVGLVSPYGVDVSSGVESSRGVKDITLIRAFCQAVREANQTG